ncbi:hypothetical protein BELL_0544g00050 [Botrytis elliptica]|uniref:Uncharacterized protein n=1 Tax=Botrytis elliptica TaxID=278938 RepID=A0A4Z1JJK7_9HELO|nr:hypothetical protein EAE99_009431 [Botrytis elliptica]TGO71670.1 hypothetical protein BELL_0544g00050 [Botrytis elliptica]
MLFDIEISTSLPAVKNVKKTFTFQDLSGELRNKIYELLLCDFEEVLVPCQFSDLPSTDQVAITRHHIHPQILRTCRQMYQEGTYLMRMKNLFVRFECEVSPYQNTLALLETKVPFLVPDPSTSRDFKGTVLTHKICYRNSRSRPQPSATFILLARHIPDLCRVLSKIRWKINLHDENVKHIVTLTDPYAEQISGFSALFGSVSAFVSLPRGIESFLTRRKQEELIAPYRTHLKAFPNLEFNGVIPKDLQKNATSEIAFMPEVYSKDQIQIFEDNIEHMADQGQIFFVEKRYVKAIRVWAQCQELIFSQCSGKRGERLLKGLEVASLNNIADILFHIACMRAETTLHLMKTKWIGNHEKIVIEAALIAKAEEDYITWLTDHKKKVTYVYDADKDARMYFNLSKIFQQSGHLEWAIDAILQARHIDPNDREFVDEEARVRSAIFKEFRRKWIPIYGTSYAILNPNRFLPKRFFGYEIQFLIF